MPSCTQAYGSTHGDFAPLDWVRKNHLAQQLTRAMHFRVFFSYEKLRTWCLDTIGSKTAHEGQFHGVGIKYQTPSSLGVLMDARNRAPTGKPET